MSARIVHTHSTYATTLAIARKDIPACHYMIAAFGGPTSAAPTTRPTARRSCRTNALEALEGRTCCLLANHGMIATGANLAKAMWLAVELETIAKQYYSDAVHRRPGRAPGRRRSSGQGARSRATARGPRRSRQTSTAATDPKRKEQQG